MEVEYNEKPRGGVFPIKLVGCDNGYYVNLNKNCIFVVYMLQWY